MKIILPKIIYELFYKDGVHSKWLIFKINKKEITPIMMSNSFKALYKELKKI
jgi:hypothetical protein